MKAREIAGTGTVIVLGQALIALIGVGALRLYTQLVPAGVFGASNLILSGLGLGLQLFVAGFTAVQLRYFSEADASGAASDFAREVTGWALCGAAVLAFLVIMAGGVAIRFARWSYSWPVVGTAVAWIFIVTIRNVLMSHVQAQRRQVPYVVLQVVEAVALVGATAAALRASPTVESYLLGQVIATAIVVVVVNLMDHWPIRSVKFERRSLFLRRVRSYGSAFAPMSLLTWLANLGDRYTVAALLGAEATGRYVAPFSIASRGMLFANTALCDLFRPLLFDAEGRRDRRRARQLFRGWLACSAVMSSCGIAVVYLGGNVLARLLLAPAYRAGAIHIMLWVVVGYAVSNIDQVLENRVLSLGVSARLLAPLILGGVSNVAFSVLFILRHGIVGAAQASCASFVVQVMATAVFLVHTQRMQQLADAREVPIEIA